MARTSVTLRCRAHEVYTDEGELRLVIEILSASGELLGISVADPRYYEDDEEP